MSDEHHESDGFGKTKSPDGLHLIKIWVNIRRDTQIPEFDTISDLKWTFEGEGEPGPRNLKVLEIATEHGGMFVEDALKLKERDILSLLGEAPGFEVEPIPALRALKKALVDYLEKSGQHHRALKATQTLVCNCRHVTDQEIETAVKSGHNTFELVRMATGAGSGCNSCVNKVKELVEKYKN